MKVQRILISILIFFIFFTQIVSQKANSNSPNQPELEVILKKCSEYCEKLANSALYFVCKEKIKEEIFYSISHQLRKFRVSSPSRIYYMGGPVTGKNVYIYDYQLIRKDRKIKESRTLIEENGKEKNEKDAPLKTKHFFHERIILGPVGLLSEFWQQYYKYKIIKEKKIMGEKAIIIEATPISLFLEGNYLYGRIWVRKADFSILKIEWEPKSLKNYDKVEEYAKSLNAKPEIKFFSEYAFEKNGIRFPSKYSITETYILRGGGRYTRSKTTVTYKDYKFFTVETEVKY